MRSENDKSTLIEDLKFREFVMRNFEDTIIHATIEDMANFAFGSLVEAIEVYKDTIKCESIEY